MPILATLSLAAATLCWNDQCVPALVGHDTPTGIYTLSPQPTHERGYGGDILLFKSTDTAWYAVHRTWPGRERLYKLPAERRRNVSMGCVNIEPASYAELSRTVADGGGGYIQIIP